MIGWFFGCVRAACVRLAPRQLRVGRPALSLALRQCFPLEAGQGMLRLTLSDPRLEAGAAPDRLAVTCDYRVSGSLGMTRAGRVGFSTELGYDSGRRAVVMSHPRIDLFDWQGTEALAGLVRNLINFALGKFLNGYPLYCLPPGQPRFVGVELEIIGIAVMSGELRLRLRPASISA